MSIIVQEDLFRAADRTLPEGFRYSAEIVRPDLQRTVLEAMPTLAFKAFDFHGFEGKRRTVSFGWKYDFDSQRVRRADAMPSVLLPIREVVARFAGIEPDALVQALVTEYGPGAPIGWHKDKFVFGRVVGVSLLSSCTFRLRRRDGAKWQRRSLVLEPGSTYLMAGASRTFWEHSIPPVDRLRYSITFRELAE
ncbi:MULTISPECIES: alpha-ketoglutarate-dependent dioxygenase AlkB [Rhizobium]|uniref:Alpha-ketoglutarate-dependent dioxygenase AlkB n=1 Tax=Rhizobium laguerreae TaxID=1076926 RepID=A0A7Y2R6Z0_9HYPH|nr:alpha-ketoglutarate-dependent dioxygenase AlkB [Rhizobium laguerreae]NNH65335.1 alpha-ketoglutarate-dependent dioxygenase AlkB [Rhizobium laguerreae]